MIMPGAARRWENAFYQHASSLLDSSQWQGLAAGALLTLSTPGERAWWSTFGSVYFGADFRQWVDSSLLDAPTRAKLI